VPVSTTSAVRWALSQPAETPLHVFGNEAVVFNPASWETHLVNLAAAEIIASLSERPKLGEELVAELLALTEPPVDTDALRRRILEHLGELESLGLVRAVEAR